MQTYHFDIGDSTRGPIGMCARIRARSKKDALARLRRAIRDAVGPFNQISIGPRGSTSEYINVYLAPDNLSSSDIDSVEEGARARRG
jgi:hypothetical protein